MADAAPRGGGFAARGGDRGGRGRGRGRGRRGGNKSEEKEWQPVTKLGRLVKAGKIRSMEEIYLHSLPIKEYQIVDFFLPKLKDEVMKVRETGSMKRVGWMLKAVESHLRIVLHACYERCPIRDRTTEDEQLFCAEREERSLT